jgi:hypothetical protein
MIELFHDGGFMMIPLLVTTLAVVALTIRSWMTMPRERGGADAVVETRIDSVLFWGAYGVVLGILGTLVGIAVAAQAIERAGAASMNAAVVWGGIKAALITVIFGFLVFSFALVVWFLLRVRYRRVVGA